MSLVPKIKQQLKGRAHSLRPIVFIGNNGLTETVNQEVDRALTDHELIKIRIQNSDREVRRAIFAEVCKTHNAESVQFIGSIGTLYRKNPE